MRGAKTCQDLRWQFGQVEESAEPALAYVKSPCHCLLAFAVIPFKSARVIGRSLEIRKITPTSVFQICNSESFFVGELSGFNQKAKVGKTIGAHPCYAPVSPRSANYLILNTRIVRDAANNRRDFLPPLGLKTLDQITAAIRVERPVVAIMPFPNSTQTRLHQFLNAGHTLATRQLRKTVLSSTKQAGSWRQARVYHRRLAGSGKCVGKSLISCHSIFFLYLSRV